MEQPEQNSVRSSQAEQDASPDEGKSGAAVPVLAADDVSIYYGSFQAVADVSLTIHEREITAFIGPSGSGKSTMLRAFNRMDDLVPGAHVDGQIYYRGMPLYRPDVSAVAVRRRIGMVFQEPNPFPKSIYANVAYGPRTIGERDHHQLDLIVERSLRRSALWDEVKNRLQASALSLSGGQAQRLCIARTIAVEPDVVLMDEPCSSLDPVATARIEDLMRELKRRYTIVIVTHNMQQAARISDRTAFFFVRTGTDADSHTGGLVEYGATQQIFENPRDPRTRAYVTGRMG